MADDKASVEPEIISNGGVEDGPPPRLPKPSFDDMKKEQDKVKDEKKDIGKKIKKIDDQIKEMIQKSAGDDDGLKAAKAALKTLKADRERYHLDRQRLYGIRDAARESRDAKMSEMKDLKSQSKYKDVDAIDRKIAELEQKQSTTSMSLKQEKELISEIKDLKSQRGILAQHSAVKATLDDGSVVVDAGAQIKEVNEKLAKIKAEVDKHQGVLNKAIDKQKNSEKAKLEEEKENLFQQKKAKDDEIKKIYDEFLVKKKEWEENNKKYQEYLKKEKKERAEQAAKEKEARAAAAKAELEAKTPYEEEMLLCDYLCNYLETTFLAGKEESKTSSSDVAPAALSGEFANMTVTTKKGKDDPYLAATGKKGPKGKKGGAKKGAAGTKKGSILLVPETFESFGLLKMDPPKSLDEVEAAVAALAKKKAEFKTMPRGQIKSIAEINYEMRLKQENERPARKEFGDARGGAGGGGGRGGGAKANGGGRGKGPKNGGGKKPDALSDSDFPSLGGAPKAKKENVGAEETKA